MKSIVRGAAGTAVGAVLLSTPAAAHGVAAAATGLPFTLVVAGVVVVSLLGGGVVLVAYGRVSAVTHRAIVPLLVAGLGCAALGLAISRATATTLVGTAVGAGVVYLGRDAGVTDCGACADATLGAVTLHRGLEGVVLATVYAADAALGLAGAVVVAVHAAAETAAVGSLYAVAGRRYAVAAVCLVQAGFVGGVAVGWSVVDGIPPVAEAGVLALVGGVLLAVGGREGYHRYTGERPVTAT